MKLRADGLDVVSVFEVAATSNDDEAQLLFAASHGRILLTQNQIDFRRLHVTFRQANRTHAGIMLVPQTVPYLRLEQRVRLMIDWVTTFEEHRSQLYTWSTLQQAIIHGLRLPDWDEPIVRDAIGWRP
jgi:hypothetical protein